MIALLVTAVVIDYVVAMIYAHNMYVSRAAKMHRVTHSNLSVETMANRIMRRAYLAAAFPFIYLIAIVLIDVKRSRTLRKNFKHA